MQMEEKLEKMSEHLEALEREYHSDKKVVKVGAAIFVVLLVAFFGISLSQINSHVDRAMKSTAILESESIAKGAADNAKQAADKASEYRDQIESVCADVNGYEVVGFYQYYSTAGPYRTYYSTDPEVRSTGFARSEETWFRAFGPAVDQ